MSATPAGSAGRGPEWRARAAPGRIAAKRRRSQAVACRVRTTAGCRHRWPGALRQAATSRRRATGHDARERDTGERRDAGAGMAAPPHLPDRGQAADAHGRGLSCGRPDAGSRPNVHVATPVPQATTPVNATRTNGGTRGQHLPDRGRRLVVPTPGRPATQPRFPPVNATRANGGPRGRERWHLPDRGQAADTHSQHSGGERVAVAPTRCIAEHPPHLQMI